MKRIFFVSTNHHQKCNKFYHSNFNGISFFFYNLICLQRTEYAKIKNVNRENLLNLLSSLFD